MSAETKIDNQKECETCARGRNNGQQYLYSRRAGHYTLQIQLNTSLRGHLVVAPHIATTNHNRTPLKLIVTSNLKSEGFTKRCPIIYATDCMCLHIFIFSRDAIAHRHTAATWLGMRWILSAMICAAWRRNPQNNCASLFGCVLCGVFD